ncbi:MAG: DUF2779 domain-containing protein [Sedimenticola sp.]
MSIEPALSKSQYIKGMQCPKALWYYRNRKDLIPPVDPATQARFDAGDEIGELAQRYFGDGVEVTNEYWDIEGAIEVTNKYIEEGQELIFEATAINPRDGSYSRIDILRKVPETDQWDLIEVKSSTEVKETHHNDLAFQYYVFHGAGYDIRKCQMMVIDNQYVREGEIDPNGLFRLEEITDIVLSKQEEVEYWVTQLNNALERKHEPEATIGARCFDPYECVFKDHCWAHVPNYSVYNVYPKKKADEISQRIGGYDIHKVPPELYPGGAKAVDLECHQNDKEYLDRDNVRDFLRTFEYPLYYLDYETMMGGLPLYDGTRPYQQIPFQFSLHVQEGPVAEVQHFEFLHKETSDPRRHFAETLVDLCGDEGSVVVYNESFEKSRNRELAESFPQLSNELYALNERVVDLMLPFQKRWLYKPEQRGSYSIKYVLPAYVPGLSYEGMAIANGGDAMERYYNFVKGTVPEDEQEELWIALSEYCRLDTYAMVELLRVLEELV